jgi:menaquinone-dependent protoporphyrinogen oxidase
MSMATLIAYATKHGVTEKCARELQKRIPGGAELYNLKNGTPDLSKYDSVILGASVYAGMPRKQVKAFALKYADSLAKKKLGLFLCCLSDGEQAQKQMESAYPAELRKVACAQGVLGGGFNVSDMGSFEKFIVKKISGADVKDSLNVRQDVMEKFVKAFSVA